MRVYAKTRHVCVLVRGQLHHMPEKMIACVNIDLDGNVHMYINLYN